MKKHLLIILAIGLITLSACSEKVGQAGESSSKTVQPQQSVSESSVESVESTAAGESESAVFEYKDAEGGIVITKYTGKDKTVAVPPQIDGKPVVQIGHHSFEAKYRITSVTLPDTVTLIGEAAFQDCESLESINIPAGVTGIERHAFASCLSLTEVTIPESMKYVNELTFDACDNLESLTILNPDLAYENWWLEKPPSLTVYGASGSAVESWASGMGIFESLS